MVVGFGRYQDHPLEEKPSRHPKKVRSGWANYYPGDNYVDVASLDVWYKNYPSTADYQQMRTIAGAKPIALAEMGKVPNAALLESQTRWSYFMLWSEQLRGNNTNAEIQAGYFHPRVLNQGEVKLPATAARH